MRIFDHLSEECIIIGAQSVNKDVLVRTAVGKLCSVHDILEEEAVYEAVMEKEMVMSTGIGCGLAIPHAKVDFVNKMHLAAISLKRGADFSSIDKEPVYLLFLLISPKEATGPHIQALSSICRVVSDSKLRNSLIQATTSQEFYKTLRDWEEKNS